MEPDPAQPTNSSASSAHGADGRVRSILRTVLRLLLPLAVLAAGGAVAVHLFETAPEAKRKRPERRANLVEVERVTVSRHRVAVEAMGTVVPARTVELHPRVSGEVVEVSSDLAPGGIFRAGDIMLRLDPVDYELAVRETESEVAKAEADLALEMGNQTVAQKEFELLGDVIRDEDRELVLRKPQLATVEASLDRSRAALMKARLDLERTTVRAPFNATIQSRAVEVGARVTEATVLATLVGTDAFWVEVAVPVDDLKWIQVPDGANQPGSKARIHDPAAWGNGRYRTGKVIRVAPDLEEQGRMARVLLEVTDPLVLQREPKGPLPLLLSSYVRVEIQGPELPSAVALDRRFLRDGDTVWVMDGEDRLDVRPVEIAFRTRDEVFVTAGLRHAERLVTTDLPAPVPGMALRTGEDAAAAPSADGRERAPEARGAGASRP